MKSRTIMAKWHSPPTSASCLYKQIDQADYIQEGEGGMKWHVGHGRELSEKESDQRCLLIGVKQVICLGRGRPLIGFINRLSHQQIKYFNKNYTLPAKCRLDIHALLGKRVSFHLNTCLNSEAKGAVSLEGEWMTVRLYTMELCSMHLLPHLHSCSPWCKWKWNSNNSEHFLDVPWEAQCYICCILSMALTLLTLRADEQQQDSQLPSSSSWPSYVCLATWRTSTIS